MAEALQAGNVYIDCNYMLWVCEEAEGGGLVLRDPYGLRPALKIGDSQDLAKYMRLAWTIEEVREWEAETSEPSEQAALEAAGIRPSAQQQAAELVAV